MVWPRWGIYYIFTFDFYGPLFHVGLEVETESTSLTKSTQYLLFKNWASNLNLLREMEIWTSTNLQKLSNSICCRRNRDSIKRLSWGYFYKCHLVKNAFSDLKYNVCRFCEHCLLMYSIWKVIVLRSFPTLWFWWGFSWFFWKRHLSFLWSSLQMCFIERINLNQKNVRHITRCYTIYKAKNWYTLLIVWHESATMHKARILNKLFPVWCGRPWLHKAQKFTKFNNLGMNLEQRANINKHQWPHSLSLWLIGRQFLQLRSKIRWKTFETKYSIMGSVDTILIPLNILQIFRYMIISPPDYKSHGQQSSCNPAIWQHSNWSL